MSRIYFDLKLKRGNRLFINSDFVDRIKEELENFLLDKAILKDKAFAQRVMYTQEIKANNLIEGFQDSISFIEKIIADRDNLKNLDEKSRRILNLCDGYSFASKMSSINKVTLDELYTILSKDLLTDYELENRKGYYRDKDVYIFFSDFHPPDMGMEPSTINYYMDQLFDYINNDNNLDTLTDFYIKSQILHFYFVYIHPYYDVNGRTSRTLSMAYLLQHQIYPYIIFNRGINFAKNDYYRAIRTSQLVGNLTSFIIYMLNQVRGELEKEYLIMTAEQSKGKMTLLERQTLNYILSMKSARTLKDFTRFYNYYNDKVSLQDVHKNMVTPLLEKGVLTQGRFTKNSTNSSLKNYFFTVNTDCMDYKPDEIKKLIL